MRFVDANVLLYAVSSSPIDTPKFERAVALLNEPDRALSVQVLEEFHVLATRATRPSALSHAEATALIRTWTRFPVQPVTFEIVNAALDAKMRWRVSYWDAAIIEAARALRCDVLLSEGPKHGQNFDGVRVTNPFR